MRYAWWISLLLVGGCERHTGHLDEACNPDGTCKSQRLSCGPSPHWINQRCNLIADFKPEPVVMPPAASVIFCDQCAERCGKDGIKRCAFTDALPFGKELATCDCREANQ